MIRLLAVLFLLPSLSAAQSLVPNGRIILKPGISDFGGLSGIEVMHDGQFLAISDQGKLFQGDLIFGDGKLSEVNVTWSVPILDSKGNALTGHNTNAEGLAIGPDGDIIISFEGNHRIMDHENPTAPAKFLPKHPDFRNLQANSGLEAIAVNSDGTVLAIPERSGDLQRPFPVYLFDGTVWVKSEGIPRVGDFLVTGTDFGPDGRLYVLERSFKAFSGFAFRIRRFALDGEMLTHEETLLTSHTYKLDNMEGISVWVDQNGLAHLTLVSDDNFNPLQRSVIADYLVTD